MPTDFQWQDEAHSIIRIDMFDVPTWEEYHATFDQVARMIRNSNHRVDIIINDTGSGLPSGSPLTHFKSTARMLAHYPNMGVIVVAGTHTVNRVVKTLVQMVFRVYGIDKRIIGDFVTSIKDAETSIARDRAQSVAYIE